MSPTLLTELDKPQHQTPHQFLDQKRKEYIDTQFPDLNITLSMPENQKITPLKKYVLDSVVKLILPIR